MNNDARRLFYTQEEINDMSAMDKLSFEIHKAWYNFTEWFLTLKESDNRWIKKVEKK